MAAVQVGHMKLKEGKLPEVSKERLAEGIQAALRGLKLETALERAVVDYLLRGTGKWYDVDVQLSSKMPGNVHLHVQTKACEPNWKFEGDAAFWEALGNMPGGAHLYTHDFKALLDKGHGFYYLDASDIVKASGDGLYYIPFLDKSSKTPVGVVVGTSRATTSFGPGEGTWSEA